MKNERKKNEEFKTPWSVKVNTLFFNWRTFLKCAVFLDSYEIDNEIFRF